MIGAARRSWRRARRVWPLLAAGFLLFICVMGAPEAIKASRNEGVPGTFTADEEFCGRRTGCDWLGTFESDDGRIKEQTTMTTGAAKEHGDVVRAQKVGSELYSPGSHTWVLFAIAGPGSLLYIAWFCWNWRRRARAA